MKLFKIHKIFDLHTLVLFVSILLLTPVFGQRLSGIIYDSAQSPIEYVSVMIKNSKTAVNTISDSLGHFKFENVTTGKYKIEFSRVNYKKLSKELTLINDTVLSIKLDPDITFLKEVLVSNKKKLIEKKADAFILNVDGNISSKGKNTVQVLRYAPGLSITNDNINMVGREGVSVYLNDRLIRLSGGELIAYLNTIPADQILKVEIIPSPPANFDAEGNVSIVKIYLKKAIDPGLRANLKFDFFQSSYPGLLYSGNFDIKRKKSSFWFSYSGYNLSYYNLTNSSYFINNTEILQKNYNPKKWGYNSLLYQVFYETKLTKQNTFHINFQSTLLGNSVIKDILNYSRFFNSAFPNGDSLLVTNGTTRQESATNDINISLVHNFKKEGQKATFELGYINANQYSTRPFNSKLYVNNNLQNDNNYKTDGGTKNNIYTGKIDFSSSFKKINFRTGVKVSLIDNKAENNFFDLVNSTYIVNLQQSNAFNYRESTQAGYIDFSGEIKKMSYKFGLRYERTLIDAYSKSTSSNINNNYSRLFPTVFLSYDVNEKNNLSFSYTNRINRPPYEFLDPFKWYTSEVSYSTGNPFLIPYYTTNLEVGYLNNNNLNLRIYYSYKPNYFNRMVIINPSNKNIQIQIPQNYFDKTKIGISLYKFFQPKKWLDIIWQNDFFIESFSSHDPAITNLSGFGASLSLYNIYYLSTSKKLQLFNYIQEYVPGFYDYRKKNNSFSFDFGGSYILSKKIEFSLYVVDIFKTSAPQYSYYTNNINQVYDNYYDNRQMTLTMKLNLGNFFLKTVDGKDKVSNNEEKERIAN